MVARLERLRDGIAPASHRALVLLGGQTTRLLREGYLSGGLLNARTGRLRNSIAADVTQDGAGVTLTVSAGASGQLRYAKIHETGGTITPKRGKFLAIPVGPALTGAGVARYVSPRDVPDLVFISTRNGAAGVLVKKQGRKGNERLQVWFRLVRRVKIKPKGYMRRAQRAAVQAFPVVLAEQLKRATR